MFKGVLIDLGGVVYIGDGPLPGAVEAIDRLHRACVPIRYLTNTTRTSHRELLGKIRAMGLQVSREELLTPALAARRHIEAKGLTPQLLIHPGLAEDFAGLPPGQGEALVVGDAGDAFSYAAMNEAFRSLDCGAEFLALANNRSFRDADDALSLDAGPFVAALAFASRRDPLVLGKPAKESFNSALASIGCTASEAAMIGDDAENDVGGGMAAGLTGILVRTGKYRPGDEATIDPQPDCVADDLAAAVDWLLER